MTKPIVLICPYCGVTQRNAERCRSCSGYFEVLSRQATHNAMGPWYIHGPDRAFLPGCSYETLAALIGRGMITKLTVIRGPTTKQFWTVARHVAGAAHLLGYCHACDGRVSPEDHGCPKCGVPFGAYLDRNYMGLPEVRPLPGGMSPDTGPTNGHGVDDRLRPTPRGLSAFARDDELYASSAATASFEPAAPPVGTIADDLMSNPAVKALRRRIRRQQRTLQVLTVAVVVLTLLSVTVAVGSAMSLRNQARLDDATTGDATSGARAPGDTEPAPTSHSSVDRSEPPPSAPTLATDVIDDELAPGAETPPALGLAAIYDDAVAKMDEGADAARSIQARIESYQTALGLLRSIADLAPESDRPEDLDVRIQEAVDAIERLELKAFFP